MKAAAQVCANDTDTITLLGVTLQPRSLRAMNVLVEEGIREGRRWIITNHDLDSVYLVHRHAKLRE
jgi:N-acetylglucosaminyldiphosphoundecaprenol N-acetyl-beta-D-mannosaminyltransferase